MPCVLLHIKSTHWYTYALPKGNSVSSWELAKVEVSGSWTRYFHLGLWTNDFRLGICQGRGPLSMDERSTTDLRPEKLRLKMRALLLALTWDSRDNNKNKPGWELHRECSGWWT